MLVQSSAKNVWETPKLFTLSLQKTETFCTDNGKPDGSGDGTVGGCGAAIS